LRHDVVQAFITKTRTFFRLLPDRKTRVELSIKKTLIRKLVK